MARRVVSVSPGVLRDAHMVLDPVSGLHVPSTLLEGATTNLCVRSEELELWTHTNSPTVVDDAIPASTAGVALTEITDDSATLVEQVERTVAFTGDGTKAVSFFWKSHPSEPASGTQVLCRDVTAGVSRMVANITTGVGGAPSVAVPAGTYLGYESLTDGIYRLMFSVPGVVAANTNRIRINTAATAAQTGSCYVGGFQAGDVAAPSSYVKTEASTVTRSAETLHYPWTLTPQAMTVYCRFIERGTALLAGSVRIWQIASSTPSFFVFRNSSGYRLQHNNGVTTQVTSSDALTLPTWGARVELLAELHADGSVRLHQSINGGAVASAVQSAAHALQPAWGTPTLAIGSTGAGGRGIAAFLPGGYGQLVTVRRSIHDMTAMRAAYSEA